MYDRVLVPVDGSQASDRAIAYAFALVEGTDAIVHALYVGDTSEIPDDALAGLPDLETVGGTVLDTFTDRGRAAGITTARAHRQGDPIAEIRRYVDEHQIDLLVVGRHPGGRIERFLKRGLTQQLMQSVQRPILSVPESASSTPEFGTVLFATDGRDGAAQVERHALYIAKRADALLQVVHVLNTRLGRSGPLHEVLEREGKWVVREANARAVRESIDTTTNVLEGRPSREILDHARETGCDLLVVGTGNRRGLDQLIVGSVAAHLVAESDCPVLVIPAETRQ